MCNLNIGHMLGHQISKKNCLIKNSIHRFINFSRQESTANCVLTIVLSGTGYFSEPLQALCILQLPTHYSKDYEETQMVLINTVPPTFGKWRYRKCSLASYPQLLPTLGSLAGSCKRSEGAWGEVGDG